MSEERSLRERLCKWGRSLHARGYAPGSSGNLSCRIEDGFLFTPTNSCLGFLEPDRIAKIGADRRHVAGDPPTKELPLHLAFYEGRPDARAVVHLHSTAATALSCLSDTDPENAILPITPYVVMRVGRVAVLPYTHPGSREIAPLLGARAAEHIAFLLANHGPVVAGTTLENAVFAAEELEETAKLILLLRGLPLRTLSEDAIAELSAAYRLQ